MKEEIVCPHCGEKENFHFNYDYVQKQMPIINVMCNECGEFFEIKEQPTS
jgi:transcription elongation factor Elf1